MIVDGKPLNKEGLEAVVLQRARYQAGKVLGAFALSQMKVDVHRMAQSMGRDLSISLTTAMLEKVYRRKCETDYTEVPKTWWDAFKLRWFPRWGLRRWPAEMRHIATLIEHHEHRGCPHLNIVLPGDQSKHILWMLDSEKTDE